MNCYLKWHNDNFSHFPERNDLSMVRGWELQKVTQSSSPAEPRYACNPPRPWQALLRAGHSLCSHPVQACLTVPRCLQWPLTFLRYVCLFLVPHEGTSSPEPGFRPSSCFKCCAHTCLPWSRLLKTCIRWIKDICGQTLVVEETVIIRKIIDMKTNLWVPVC